MSIVNQLILHQNTAARLAMTLCWWRHRNKLQTGNVYCAPQLREVMNCEYHKMKLLIKIDHLTFNSAIVILDVACTKNICPNCYNSLLKSDVVKPLSWYTHTHTHSRTRLRARDRRWVTSSCEDQGAQHTTIKIIDLKVQSKTRCIRSSTFTIHPHDIQNTSYL